MDVNERNDAERDAVQAIYDRLDYMGRTELLMEATLGRDEYTRSIAKEMLDEKFPSTY
jgi:hypothetical protein